MGIENFLLRATEFPKRHPSIASVINITTSIAGAVIYSTSPDVGTGILAAAGAGWLVTIEGQYRKGFDAGKASRSE